MIRLSHSLAAAAALSLMASVVPSARAIDIDPNPAIIIELEQPTDGVNTGINLVRGYALGPAAIDVVEWWLDGEYLGVIPYGGSRGDVEGAFPGLPDSANAGFATAWNWGLPEPGMHEIRVRAIDENGGFREVTRTFETRRFGADAFVTAEEMSLDAFQLDALQPAAGDFYETTLAWSAADQQFVIQEIELDCGGCELLNANGPIALTAEKSGGDVELEWEHFVGEFGGNPLGYYVERRLVIAALPILSPPFVRVGITAGARRYTDEDVDLSPGLGFYEYRVLAVFAETVIGPSNEVTVTRNQLIPILP